MPRWATIVIGTLVLVLAGWLVLKGKGVRTATAKAEAPSSDDAGGAAGVEAEAGSIFDLTAIAAPTASAPTSEATGVGARFPDGAPVPALPDKAPLQVRFGVVLVTFAGAQGAPEHARSVREAHDIAVKLSADAQGDFHAAVVHGDSGSVDDAGRMPRGVLEPALEYALFTLPVGGVSEPLETPRGYWIVKRLE